MAIYENPPSKMIFFGDNNFFFPLILISKMDLRIITKNPAADQEKGFLTKSGSDPYGRETAMPTACVLTYCSNLKIKFPTLY